MTDDGVCLNQRTHSSLHDIRPHVKEAYAKWYDRNYPWSRWDPMLPEVHQMSQPQLAVWHHTTRWGNSSCSLWLPTEDEEKESQCATGPGFFPPPNPHVQPTRTLVGNFGFYTTWFTGHYGHFNHDYLPSLAYMRAVTRSAYGNNTAKFILVDFERCRELVQFMDPDFYKRVEWIQFDEVVKIDGEITYLTPQSIPQNAGHALMSHLRQWLTEAHPFDAADFHTHQHILYYDRVGSNAVNHGRVLDADQQWQILVTIRAAMEKYGLANQELVLFNGHNKQGETLSPAEQFQLFRRASTIIGPHGTGISNMVWTNPNPQGCEARTQLLEFVPGPDVADVQGIYAGYYRSFRGLPIDYHELFYQLPSTNSKTFISLTELENALDVMWSGKQIIHVEESVLSLSKVS